MTENGEPAWTAELNLNTHVVRPLHALSNTWCATGGFLGIGHSLHAIPWSALTLDAIDECFVIDIPAQRLKHEPGFDKHHWPSAGDEKWSDAADSGRVRRP